MKLLIENWRQYLNEEREFGPGVQRIHDYYNSDKAMEAGETSELSGSEVFELAFKLSRMQAEQSVALIDSLGFSPLATKVLMRAVAGLLIAEESDLENKWKAMTRSSSGATNYEIQSLRDARAMNQENLREFLTIWLKKQKEMNNETPT